MMLLGIGVQLWFIVQMEVGKIPTLEVEEQYSYEFLFYDLILQFWY